MSIPTVFRVRYWGVTGSFAKCLSPEDVLEKVVGTIETLLQDGTLRAWATQQVDRDAIRAAVLNHVPFELRSTYGGNTSCIQIETPDRLIVLDAGSGFRELGRELVRQWDAPNYRGDQSADILLTHPHMDHTYAIPFFDPFHDPRNRFTLWAPQSVLDSLDALLSHQSVLRSVFFPIQYEQLPGIIDLKPIQPGESFEIGGTTLKSLALQHPGGCVAYRLQHSGRRIVFASDHEQSEVPDRTLAAFAQGADLFYTDAQYFQDEYDGTVGIEGERALSRHGWGHSSVEAAVQTAIEARVRILHLCHHEPKRTDAGLTLLEHRARKMSTDRLTRAGRSPSEMAVSIAREGLITEI